MAKDLTGKTLGSYELTEVAGEGGLATVYKAYQRSLDRWVAVKVLHIHDEEILARFKREAKAIARLRHRNILTVYEYGEADERPYIAMEYVENGTLEKYLLDEPMDWVQVIRIAAPIAEALHHAHQQGLIHRDVKPSNILMPQEDWPLLADFGLVKMTEAEKSLTMTGVVLGTPSYIAPEMVLGKPADLRCDMYSLGVIMFELITGRLPFAYRHANRQMLAHISEQPPSPRELNPECPPELETVILKALEKSVEDRYADMEAMVEALMKIMGNSTVPLPSTSSLFRTTSRSVSELTPRRPSAPLEVAEPEVESQQSDLPQPSLVLSEKNVTIPLPEPGQNGLIIGRTHGKNRADIDLGPHGAAEAGISRQHARLTKSKNGWQIDDLDSLNGTYVNNVKLTPGSPVTLKDGDTIRCSVLSFAFQTPDGT